MSALLVIAARRDDGFSSAIGRVNAFFIVFLIRRLYWPTAAKVVFAKLWVASLLLHRAMPQV